MSGIFTNSPGFNSNLISASGFISYNNDDIQEGFREVFAAEFKEQMSVSNISGVPNTGRPDIRLFRTRTTQAAPAPQAKAMPPPSQPTKPIINEQGRVKRAFDFND